MTLCTDCVLGKLYNDNQIINSHHFLIQQIRSPRNDKWQLQLEKMIQIYLRLWASFTGVPPITFHCHTHITLVRSSLSQMFFWIGFLKHFVNFTGKHLFGSLLLKRKPSGVFLIFSGGVEDVAQVFLSLILNIFLTFF